MQEGFDDRHAAGRALGRALTPYRDRPQLLVLGLARGGLPVASAVAEVLGGELDVFLVRKIGAPSQPELALGAVASGGIRNLNEEVIEALGVRRKAVDRATRQAQAELEARERRYRFGHPAAPIKGRTVILVDDGVATGATLEAAVSAVRRQDPAELVVAVPVAAPEARQRLEPLADDFVALLLPTAVGAVGQWYRRFDQTSDDEVARLLEAASEEDTHARGV